MRTKSQKKKNHSGQFFEITLLAVFIVVFLIIVLQTIKITKGVAKVVEVPESIVRVQIQYNPDNKEKADLFEEFLSNYHDNKVEFVIVEKNEFTIRDIKETIIINRTKETKSSEFLADLLGLDEQLIVQKVLSENKMHVTLTLVIGNDADLILSKLSKNKEQ